MSYDVRIGDYDGNMTSNISAVFYDHMDGGLPSLNGLTGAQCCQKLEQFWDRVNKTRLRLYKPETFGEPTMEAKYNAPNGWGSLVGTLIFAGQITAACANNRRARMHVHY